MSNKGQQVYISYAWGGESERIANELDSDLQASGIAIIRDKRDLGYKGMISDFMQEIGHGHAIVVIVSDKYLKSSNCMYELVKIAKTKEIHERIFPIVLEDADIYNPVNRIKYIKHWEDKLKELDEAIRSVSAANLGGVRDEIDIYDEIRDNISKLTFLFKDMNTLTPDMHEGSDFSNLISVLKKRLGDESDSHQPVSKIVSPKEKTAKTSNELKSKEEADRLATQESEADKSVKQKTQIAKAKVETERRTRKTADHLTAQKSQADKIAKQMAEDQRNAKEKEETERKAKKEADFLATQKTKVHKLTKL